MLFEDTGEVLGGLETAGKAYLLDGHLRVPQQLDRFVDPDLVQVVQRGEVQVLGEQFAQVPFSDSGLRRDIADRDIGLVVQTDIGDRLFQRIVCTNRKIGLIEITVNQDQQLGIVHDNQILVVFALLVHLVDNTLHGAHDPDVIHNLDQPVFFGKDRDRRQILRLPVPVRIEAGEDFRQELQLHQGRIFGTGLEGMLHIGTDHHHLVLAEADTLVLQMQDAIALLHIVDLDTQMLMRPECLERAERHKAKHIQPMNMKSEAKRS